MLKENIKKIEDSIKELNNCIENKKCLPKEVLDNKLKVITISLDKLKKHSDNWMKDILKPISEMDFSLLVDACEVYINELNKYGYVDIDYKKYILQEALRAIYGKDVFKWIGRQEGKY